MSTIQLSETIDVDPSQIASATLERKGAKISSTVVTVASGDFQDLRVPEDSLIVRLHDGAEFVVRGEKEAEAAWTKLSEAKKQGNLGFDLNKSD